MTDYTNSDYERGILGSFILNQSTIADLGVTPGIFYYDKNRRIFDAMKKIMADGGNLSLTTVAGSKVVDASYIAELTHNPAPAQFYYKELVKLKKKRDIMSMSIASMDALKDESKSPESIVSEIESSLLKIEEQYEGGYKRVSSFLKEVIDDIEESMNGKWSSDVISTGFDGLDALLDGMRKEEYIIIGARPGTGKTSVCLNMTISAMRKGKKVGFFSAEMSKGLITKRMMCSMAGVNGQKLRSGRMTRDDLEKIMVAAESLYSGDVYINDLPNISMNTLVNEARRMKRKEGIDVLFVDYMSLISVESDAPRHEQVADLSRRFKQLARELNIPVIVIVQVNRDAQDKRPSMANLRESGAIEQDADVIILMWNRGWSEEDQTKVKVTFIVEKNRNGAIGDVDMLFKPDITRFYDIAE